MARFYCGHCTYRDGDVGHALCEEEAFPVCRRCLGRWQWGTMLSDNASTEGQINSSKATRGYYAIQAQRVQLPIPIKPRAVWKHSPREVFMKNVLSNYSSTMKNTNYRIISSHFLVFPFKCCSYSPLLPFPMSPLKAKPSSVESLGYQSISYLVVLLQSFPSSFSCMGDVGLWKEPWCGAR